MTKQATASDSQRLAGKAEAELLTQFFVLYKTARILDEKNASFKNRLTAFCTLLKNVSNELGDIAIKVADGRYFINDKLVRFDDQGLSGAATIVAEWKSLGLGGMKLSSNIMPEEVSSLFTFIAAIRPTQDKLETLSQQLVQSKLSSVQLLSSKEIDRGSPLASAELRKTFRTQARTAFFQAVTVVQDVIASASQNKEINAAKTRRVVHGLIDHISRDEASLIELAGIRDFDDYTYAHSTNVCVYSLTIGVRMGLDRAKLSQLGMAALFHDVGKVRLPKDLIRKPDAYDENDWVQMQRHPLLGAKTILRNMKLDLHTARSARSALEHHINNDFTGYPTLHYKRREPDLFSKIISIADTFDALTSGRIYLRKAIPPDVVIKKMCHQMKVKFDPFLLKMFSGIIGVYPAGTLVLLSTNELALVLTNNENDKSRPYVKIVGNKDGLFSEPLWIDLALPEHADRAIVRQVEPERYGINVSQFILED